MTCPNCKAENPSGAKFCGSCGSRLAAAKAEGTFDSVFKWIGIGVVFLFVLGILSSC